MKLNISLNHKFQRIFSVTVLSLIAVGFFQSRALESLSTASSSVEFYEDKNSKSAELKVATKLPMFGFRNILAGFVFLDFLQYFGDDEARDQDGYELVPDFFESIISRDPYYRSFYLFLSGSGSIYAVDPQKSVEITERGLSHLSPNQPSDSYYVWRYKGIDELLLLGDGESAQKSFETAANWAEESVDMDSDVFAIQSRQTAEYLSANPLSTVAQVSAWSSVLTTAIDDTTRARAVANIEALGGSVTFSDDGGIKIEFAQRESQNSGS